jgi:polyphosphate glucokinase
MEILGIDIGGSGIKGALVDVDQGLLAADRFRIPTPEPSTPEAVGDVVAAIVKHFDWRGPVGCTFPAIVQHGVTHSAANVDQAWLHFAAEPFLQHRAGCPLRLVNDADAAGLAEATFGAARDVPGVVLVLTFGTGIGSALIMDGQLVPNFELGHLEIRGKDAERRASDAARTRKELTWEQWAERVNEFLARLEAYISPDLIVIGGGGSKNYAKFGELLRAERAQIVPATLLNEAGIIGAALAARSLLPASSALPVAPAVPAPAAKRQAKSPAKLAAAKAARRPAARRATKRGAQRAARVPTKPAAARKRAARPGAKKSRKSP